VDKQLTTLKEMAASADVAAGFKGKHLIGAQEQMLVVAAGHDAPVLPLLKG
jgi:hypothetical protein